jgi:hypothetical protein
LPKKGYKQSDEHRAKIAASVSAARAGTRHSDETKEKIGDGVRRAALGRNWRRYLLPARPRDHFLGVIFARLGIWEHKGLFPELTKVRRDDFEKMTSREQRRFLDKVVVRVERRPTEEDDWAIEVEFVDGTFWPSHEGLHLWNPATGLLEPVPNEPASEQ